MTADSAFSPGEDEEGLDCRKFAQKKGWGNEEGTGRKIVGFLPASAREQEDVSEAILET